MFGIGSTELLILGGIVTLLFGANKIPELAKGIGKGIRSFKEEMNKGKEDSASTEDKSIK